MKNVSAIILAAGKSTRMKSSKSKLLHEILGVPVLNYLFQTLLELEFNKIILVLGHQKDQIIEELNQNFRLKNLVIVEQKEQLGTGHAVSCALEHIDASGSSLILAADVPFVPASVLKRLISLNQKESLLLSFITAILDDPSGYGRVVKHDGLVKIIEQKDASQEEKQINIVNSGIYCVKNCFLKTAVRELKKNNFQKEYYLTDIVQKASENKNASVETLLYEGKKEEIMGVNDRFDLFNLSKNKKMEINLGWMKEGVTLHDPYTTLIEEKVRISKDTEIYSGVVLKGNTSIGENVKIYPGAWISDSVIGDDVIIRPYCVIDSSKIDKGAVIGPFAHLRPDSQIGENSKIGNFVETKKTSLGKNSKASHLTYLGDAEIGDNVNIGCGVITCNYDGHSKHKTIIEDNVFIGSDNQLCAPVRVGRGAYTASGSTITRDVPPEALAIARARQVNKEGYVKKIKKVKKNKCVE